MHAANSTAIKVKIFLMLFYFCVVIVKTFASAKVRKIFGTCKRKMHFCIKKRPEGHFLVYENLFGVPFAVVEGFDEIDSG